MHRPRLEQRTDLVQRRWYVSVRTPVDGDPPGSRPVQPEDAPECRRLAGAIGAEEARDGAGLHDEGKVVDRNLVAVPLRQPDCLDHQPTLTDDFTQPPEEERPLYFISRKHQSFLVRRPRLLPPA